MARLWMMLNLLFRLLSCYRSASFHLSLTAPHPAFAAAPWLQEAIRDYEDVMNGIIFDMNMMNPANMKLYELTSAKPPE